MSAPARQGWRTCRVVSSEPVAERIRRITIEAPTAPGRPAPPGSHVDVRVPLGGGATDVRSYSVVESDRTGRLITLSVLLAAHSRGGSAFLHRLRPDDPIEATGPLQDFAFAPGADRYVLLAGGIGVTALVAMARSLARLRVDYQVVYVGRSRPAMAYLDLLAAEHGDRLTVHVDADGTSLDVDALVAGIADAPGRTELLMCGPVRLMDGARRAWARTGLSPADLRFETFGNSGWFDAEPFDVTIAELGVTATVAPDQTMLDALTAAGAGAELMWDCRKGECGLCVMAVAGLTGQLDHRDVFLSERQQAADDRVCLCVDRVVAASDGPARIALATP